MSVIWQPALSEEAVRWREVAERVTHAHFAPLAEELDREQRYPHENVRRLVELKLAGLFIPKAYGGEGASLTATVAVVEAVGAGCSSTAAILCVCQLGAFPVLLAGRDDQKKRYLGEMINGTMTSFALSERATGSDAAAIEATATREGDGWRLRGEKYWIGNGGASRYYVVFAKSDPAAGGRGISAFMVDKETPGVVIDELCDKMGIRGTQTSNLRLDTVVPDSARIGEVNRALRLAFQTLNVGRIMVAAQSLGLALAAYREASRHAVQRHTFGTPIIENQGVGFKLADMATEISAARMMLYEAAKAYDEGRDVANLGAMAKLFASEVAHRAADAAVQIWGGLGFCKPSVVERLYRDQRILEIYEGTSEIQRLVLARAVRKEAEEFYDVIDAPRPYSDATWDPVELWSRDRIEQFQLDTLRRQLARVGATSAYYREKFIAAGFAAEALNSLDDLRRLPVTRKEDYVAGLDADPPYGTFCAVDPTEAVRVHFTSGTTGRPAPVLWTRTDLARWTDIYARYLYAQGLRAGDVLHCMFNYPWFVGGLGFTQAAERIGALVIPGGAVDTKRQIETIQHFRPKAVAGTPSFMAHVAEIAAEMGVDLARSSVEMVCVGGEPGASIPGTRARLQRLWGAKLYDCYGTTEFQPIGWETNLQSGPVIAEDFVLAEVLHPDTHAPVADGERGVLVLTHLNKQACPLIRWWTGDVVVCDHAPQPDGRTHTRLVGGVLGRADDMLIVRGVNLFPTAVEDIVRAFPGTTTEYVLVIDEAMKDAKTGFLTGVKLRIERTADAPPDLADALAARLRERLQVRFAVEVLPAGTLPRTVHKAKRVVRE